MARQGLVRRGVARRGEAWRGKAWRGLNKQEIKMVTENKVMATLANASEDYLKLLAYVQDSEHGQILEYKKVQKETGVKMDTAGKSKLRRAIIRSKREYSVIPNTGYKMASADMTMGILTFRLVGIDNKVRKAERSQKILQQQFFEELPADQKQNVLFVGAVFGAIRQSAEQGKRLYSREHKQIAQHNPIIPSNV